LNTQGVDVFLGKNMINLLDLWVPLALLGFILLAAVYFARLS
jgi:hypothetical protein